MYQVLNGELLNRLRFLDEHAENALSVRRELALIRASGQDAVTAYEESLNLVAIAAGGDKVTLDIARNVREAAAQQMRMVLREAISATVDAARVEAMTAHQYSPVAVREILSTVVRIMHDVCERNEIGHNIVVEFQKRLREQVHVQDTITGTTLTPDMIERDVLSMDDMVPLVSAVDLESPADSSQAV